MRVYKKSLAEYPQRRVYGRRLARPLNKTRAQALETLLPKLGVPENLLSEQADLDPASLFDKEFNEYCLEIGFGNGEHLSALLHQCPETGFIGAEPFIGGMAAFLKNLREHPQDNIRVLMDDALLLVHSLKDECLEKIYILNPDPWPKKRHHKRRIINSETLSQFARVLIPGGLLITATDVDDMAEWIVTQAHLHPTFEWIAETSEDWQTPPPEWTETRYAAKGAQAGHKQYFLIFRK